MGAMSIEHMHAAIRNLTSKGARQSAASKTGLFLLPLLIALAWRATLPPDAYALFAAVKGHLVEGFPVLARAPLYALPLALAAWVGVPPHLAGLLLSALGWGALSLALYETGQALQRPWAATLAAALATFTPGMLGTLGRESSWVLASFWAALALHLQRHRRAADVALALILALHLSPVTLAPVLALLLVRWHAEKVFPYRGGVLWGVAFLAWGAAVWRGFLPPPSVTPGAVLEALRHLLVESEFYWLALPLAALGYLALRHRTARAILVTALLWPALALLDTPTARAGAGVVLAFLGGLGASVVLRRAQTQGTLRLAPGVQAGLGLLLITPLALGQGASLFSRYVLRPATLHALEAQAAAWLDTHAAPESTLVASPHVAYHAYRTARTWQGSEATPPRSTFEPLPEYVVSSRSLTWELVQRAVWFRSAYVPAKRFTSPYIAASPVTVWARRPAASLPSGVQPLDALLPDYAAWVGYTYSSPWLQPGTPFSVTLYLQLPRLESGTPYTATYLSRMQLSWHDNDDAILGPVPRQAVQVVEQNANGTLVAEHFVLHAPPELKIGAYRLLASITPYHSPTNLSLYLAGEPYTQRTLFLDYLRIPWEGSLEGTQPSGARLGDAIRLVAHDLPREAAPGETIEVPLYWEALAPPAGDYTVFVHLLEKDGGGITGHDAKPLGGQYPTHTWVPGVTIFDPHPLTLPSELAPGSYRVQVGMYSWPSLERLPVTLADGTEVPERRVVIGQIEVR